MTERSWRGVSWEVGYEHFLAYASEHGSANVPRDFVCDDGFNLGAWLTTQRMFRRSGRIKAERLVLLQQHDIDWEPRAASRTANLALLSEYRAQYGDLNVPVMYRTTPGKPIGLWLKAQIEAYHDGRLADETRIDLERLGVDWTFNQVDPFDKGIEELRQYIQSVGDAHVRRSYVSPSGFRLGSWFATQKSFLKKKSLSADRAQKLLDLGVDPNRDMRDEAWMQGFENLRRYHSEMGDARVPSYYETPEGYPLGPWRRIQRDNFRKGKLRADRVDLLNRLDRSWNETRSTGWTDEQALQALQEAATLSYPLTSGKYEALRIAGGVRGPALDWFPHHFSSWAAACEAAGVDGGTDHSGAIVYTDAELEASALLFFSQCGLQSSSRAYRDWLATNEGHPSAGSIIRRFGSWPAVRRRVTGLLNPGQPN